MNRVARDLPDKLERLFWDCDFSSLSWEQHRDFIVRRILTSGDWDSIMWLRERLGDSALRSWMLEHDGRGLDARRLRFWELVLDLPRSHVDAWVQAAKKSVWEQRWHQL